ncbi:heavy-metal-associated domain-containing protein [Polaromonas sp. LjRoot131]|jgi:copper chaperone|uniref:heavy-metal-associated domain-containing protein n=1 Tax=Polaromonas sp. LjRoot131 TaxID=3342262 RepID=UPI003ECE5424
MLTFQVNDMTCGHCASTIAKAVAAVDKSARVEVDIPRKRVRVSGAASAADLTEAIQDAGYTPQEVQAEPAAAARTASGCGCGCGPQKPGSVDAGQAPASAAGSCCR